MSVFINHSCDPNVGFRGQVVYVAMRDIAAGEELCHDYSMERSDDYTLDCHCGSPLCRGRIGNCPSCRIAMAIIFRSTSGTRFSEDKIMSVTAADAVDQSILLRDDSDGITTLTLNRPAQYNALSGEMLDELQHALDAIDRDESVRVVVIAANGKAFCPGHDLKEMRSSEEREFHQALFAKCSKMMLTINRLRQPVIARVNGIATAAGCQLVANCDLAVAAEDARFAVSGINVGLFCSTPAVPLSRNMGRKQALHMLLTGDFISAQTARSYGLVNEVVPAAELESATVTLAQKIIAKSAHAISLGKDMFYRQLPMDLSDAYAYAAERMACNMDSHDAREGIDAFIEKRKPEWKGK
jgi:enoyl-CoA hydratase/carnithine racemase